MLSFTVPTSYAEQVLDITDRVQEALTELGAGNGAVLVSIPHCTCGVYLNENEDGLLDDTLKAVGFLGRLSHWRHDIIDNNAAAHLGATLVGNSVLVPVQGGTLHLGTWQRVLMIELDGPRTRQINLMVLAEA